MIDLVYYKDKQLLIDDSSMNVYAYVTNTSIVLRDIPLAMYDDSLLLDKIALFIQAGKNCDFSAFFNYLVANREYFRQFKCRAEINYVDSKLNNRKLKLVGLDNMISYLKSHPDCVVVSVNVES